jgi:5'-3' exonuclease
VVGDSADGFPGVAWLGLKGSGSYLIQYTHLEDIPKDWQEWHPSIRRPACYPNRYVNSWNDALLFRTLATLRLDVPVFETIEDLRWKGPRPNFEDQCHRMKSPDLVRRAERATKPLPVVDRSFYI